MANNPKYITQQENIIMQMSCREGNKENGFQPSSGQNKVQIIIFILLVEIMTLKINVKIYVKKKLHSNINR